MDFFVKEIILASFPSFSLFPTTIDRVGTGHCIKARHEADSYEPWSKQLTSRRAGSLGASSVGVIPLLLLSSPSLLFLFSFEQKQ